MSLKEYRERMKEDQEFIFYACGDTVEHLDRLPQAEAVKDKGYEILYLTDDVDEFVLRVLDKYEEKSFKSVSAGDLDLATEEEKKEEKKQAEEHKELFDFLKDSLDGKVKEVRLSKRLRTHPVCLTSDGALSLEMEKVLNAMPGSDGNAKAERVLEINESHPVFGTLVKLYGSDQDKLKDYAHLLYDQALLIEGLPVEDPVEFSNRVCRLMAE